MVPPFGRRIKKRIQGRGHRVTVAQMLPLPQSCSQTNLSSAPRTGKEVGVSLGIMKRTK